MKNKTQFLLLTRQIDLTKKDSSKPLSKMSLGSISIDNALLERHITDFIDRYAHLFINKKIAPDGFIEIQLEGLQYKTCNNLKIFKGLNLPAMLTIIIAKDSAGQDLAMRILNAEISIP